MSSATDRLTTPDFVLLSLFMEKDWHGYELNAELERREVQDWAGVSRPQVYYSLRKLAAQGMIGPIPSAEASGGPERQVYQIHATGRAALAVGLEQEDWATRRVPPPFLTWLALSPHAERGAVERMLDRRTHFLEEQIAREREHLEIVHAETGPLAPVAALIIAHKTAQYRSELEWLAEVRRTALDSTAKKTDAAS